MNRVGSPLASNGMVDLGSVSFTNLGIRLRKRW